MLVKVSNQSKQIWMYKNIFIDANIILDIFDKNRLSHQSSIDFYSFVTTNRYKLFTSCDIITTLYYVESRNNKQDALLKIRGINKILKVIEFSNKEVEKTCNLMLEDKDYKDLEDTIQYILAKKLKCDIIISNDKSFVSKNIKIQSSEEFCKENEIT